MLVLYCFGSTNTKLCQNKTIWATTWQKPTKWVCAQQRLRSALASAQSDQSSLGCPGASESLLCTQWVAKDPRFLHADSEDWSDWMDAKTDQTWWMPRLIWVFVGRTSFCSFCHVVAHIFFSFRLALTFVVISRILFKWCKFSPFNFWELLYRIVKLQNWSTMSLIILQNCQFI